MVPPELAGIDFITIANWGGTTNDAMVEAWARPFTERTGIEVRTAQIDYGKWVQQIRSGNIEWNWADVEDTWVVGHGDLLDPISPEEVNLNPADLVDPNTLLPKAIPEYLWCYAIGYRTDSELEHPRTWVDFFDVKRFPGRRSIYNWPVAMVEIALLGDGVPFDQLYPLDLDRAFSKIDSIRDHLVFWNTGAELQQQLVSGAADFVAGWDNRVNLLRRAGQPVAVDYNENIRQVDYFVLPKGDPKQPATIEFFKVALEPDRQADFCFRSGGLGPVTTSGFQAVEETWKPFVSSNPDNVAVSVGAVNAEWWGSRLDQITTKWYEFVGA
ncbi:MAG: extracellular solute-binding protein [Armatimonadota bacterium]|nr:extracellular solute-binding protein [Armatimonadota bacterium]